MGSVRLRFEAGGGGIAGWTLRDASLAEAPTPDDLDGLPTESATEAPPPPATHPNGALRIDHIVVFTAELDRTNAALQRAGLSLRRMREPGEPGPPVRQAFFRLGDVILEVVESPQAPDGAARFWGITVCVSEIDDCAELLGERLGEVRDAVQPGRRIATVRREAGLGLPVALISEEAR